ncbi:MAG: GGDEF domain-containing protein, partial [Pseudomonadales bacterium]|nr:GGDEF domain-containing protein [Pseudomonadales bacterium]
THIEYDNQYHQDVLVKSGFLLVLIVVVIIISSFLVVSFYMDRNIFVHIKNIVNHLNALARGDRVELDIQDPLEFKLISEAVNYMQDKILSRENDLRKVNEEFEGALIERTCELKRANEKLEHLSFHDGLTGLANRRRFDIALSDELRRLRRSSGTLSLLIIDIDYFKNYNDTLGHVAGDDCLRKIAWFLDDIVRRAPDLAARYGGEEFSVILPDVDGVSAEKVASNVREGVFNLAIEHPSSSVGRYVSVSIGAITINIDSNYSPQQMVQKADKLLYMAKEAGRNRVVFKDFTIDE